jgi:hypothetical protein
MCLFLWKAVIERNGVQRRTVHLSFRREDAQGRMRHTFPVDDRESEFDDLAVLHAVSEVGIAMRTHR